MKGFLTKVIRELGCTLAVVIIFFAAAESVTQLLTPYLNERKTDFETWASQVLNVPVTLSQVRVVWSAYEPEIVFEQVSVLDKETKKPNIEINSVKINLSIFKSLLNWKPLVDHIKVQGVHLTIHQFQPGQFHIEGLSNYSFTDKMTGEAVGANEVVNWVFSVPRLILLDIHLTCVLENKKIPTSVTLEKLILKNDGTEHAVQGQVVLNQAVPLHADVSLNWTGEFSNLKNTIANGYIYLEGVFLPQWLKDQVWHQSKIKSGLGSFKIWFDWSHDQIQKIQTQFEIYNLQWQSQIDREVHKISRLSGNVGWKRGIDFQTLSGDDILIDLPKHLWPTTSFSIQFVPIEDAIHIKSIDVEYLSVGDVKRFLLENHFLNDAQKNLTIAYDPEGVLKNLHASTTTDWNDIASVKLSTDFSIRNLKAVTPFPAIKNLTGSLDIKGFEGGLTLKSKNTSIYIAELFSDAFLFEQLNGNMKWSKDSQNNWQMEAKKIQIVNQDINVYSDATVSIPEKESAVIDLGAKFSLFKAENFSKYMPLKKLDPDLVDWLNHAFKQGRVEHGKVILKGKLSDFPFDSGAGEFAISGKAKGVDFNFAPGWPWIRNIVGSLSFVGRLLTIEVDRGEITGIPVKNVHATIPDIGKEAPEVLHVASTVDSDLAQGLAFIHQSPLEQKFGKQMSALQLQGPMQLKLSLDVPLTKPENTKVNGDVTVKKAMVSVPEWDLFLNQLSGDFQFTENEIHSNPMPAELFGTPVMLTLGAQQTAGKTNYIKANLTGNISVPVLEKWLKIPLSPYAKGATDYQVELHLQSGDQPMEVILQSDLKGVSIELPENYGKNAASTIDFSLNAFIEANQPLKIKMNYGKLLSAALTLNKVKQELTVLGGEVRLGLGANWQTAPGILLTGQIDQLDMAQIRKYFEMKSTADSKLFRGLDILVNRLSLVGQQFNQIRVKVEKAKSSWQINLSSAAVLGQVNIPVNAISQVIQAKFQRLYLQSSASNSSSFDAKSIPAVMFVGDDVRYGDKSLGRVSLNLSPSRMGVTINQFEMQSALWNLQATGSWQSGRSRLQGEVSTEKLSDLLTSWGVNSSNFVAKRGQAKFDLNWPGTPFSPTVNGLSGSTTLSLGAGRIVDIGDSGAKMGLGRMLSLFSLQTIPRRLSLDFSDLFEKGYSFDLMKADFTFKNGNAFTDDAKMDGPVARIDLKGRIGLVAHDFDLFMAVTPHVTASLPVVATFASGFNPLVGVATWVVDKVMSGGVSKVTTYQYKISGPWDNPVWGEAGAVKKGN